MDKSKLDVIQVIKDRLELPDIIHIELEVGFELTLDVLTELNTNTELLEYLSTIIPSSMTVNIVE